MPFLTIFTPTYNRQHTLIRLYKSLLYQTFNDFEWLVVDDGSSDKTEHFVHLWQQEEQITIRYIKQDNGGKHVAYNKGLDLAHGRYFFCVDSDDWLSENSIQQIFDVISCLPKSAVGVVGHKRLNDNTLLSKVFPDELQCSLYELSERYGLNGEWSIIFRTDIARQFKFPIISGERFSTESIVYDALSRNAYQFLIVNKTLTICEYQENGLSMINPYKILLSNPGCYKIYYANRIDMSLTFIDMLKNIVRYWAFKWLFGNKDFDYKGKHSILVYLMQPFGIAAYIYYISKKP